MSFLRRTPKVIAEAGATRDPFNEQESSRRGANQPPTYVSEIVRKNITNRDTLAHQRQMAQYSPFGYAIVYKMAQYTFDDWIEFTDPDGKVIMQETMVKLLELNAPYYYTQCAIMERMYGHSVLYIGKEKLHTDLKEPSQRRVTNLDAFGPELLVVDEYTKNGEPAKWKIKVKEKVAKKQVKDKQKRISAKDTYHLRTRPWPHDRSEKGIPILYPVWVQCVNVERALHSSDFYLGKVGHGTYHVSTKGSLSDGKRTQVQKATEKSSVSRVLVTDSRYIDKVEFVNASGSPVDFPKEIDTRIRIIASGTDTPYDWLMGLGGASSGGSDLIAKSLFQSLDQIRGSMEEMIRATVLAIEPQNDLKFKIRWIERYAHDEEQRSKIKMNNAQGLLMLSGIMTINEMREELGLTPLPDGNQLIADKETAQKEKENELRVNIQGLQTAEEEEATNNPGGKN